MHPMSEDFAELLDAAAAQDQPQRLLFVFARRGLPEAATATQREAFERGDGGTLTPALAVDKLPGEVPGFATLAAESEQTGVEWDVVFVAGMSGAGGHPPNEDQAVQPLRLMLKAINAGRIAQFAAFDRSGNLLRFT
jgi:hypothetical protein